MKGLNRGSGRTEHLTFLTAALNGGEAPISRPFYFTHGHGTTVRIESEARWRFQTPFGRF